MAAKSEATSLHQNEGGTVVSTLFNRNYIRIVGVSYWS